MSLAIRPLVNCGVADDHIECDGGADEGICSTFFLVASVTATHLFRVLAPSQAEGCYLLSFTLLGE